MGLDELTTSNLLLLLRTRVAESLCATGVLANITKYVPASDATSISKALFSPSNPVRLATVLESSIVAIYNLENQGELEAEFRIENDDLELNSGIEILKTAFSSSHDMAVLYRLKNPPAKVSPLIDDTIRPAKRLLKLVIFRYSTSSTIPSNGYNIIAREVRDIHCDTHYEPVGLALASNGNACIAWVYYDTELRAEVWLCGRHEHVKDNRYGQLRVPWLF